MWKLVKILAVILGVASLVQTQVLGIDFGTQFWKAALISPGKNLVIVENSRSERKTFNSISIQDGKRFFEEDSKAKQLKKPQLSYFYLNKLIRSLDTREPIEGFQFNGDTYLFKDGEKEINLEQLVAMIFRNIKEHASKQAGTDIRDVVLTVPSHWGFKAKMSLVNSAYLADLSVLGLINENSAAAIQFAITRNDTDPFNVMFFNLGSHNLQISIFKMFGHFNEQKNKTIQCIEALSHVSAENVGGLQFDNQIASYLASQFLKKHQKNPADNLKSFTKLLVKSSEVKQTLSANKETLVYIEGLMDGIDFSTPISRSVIEDNSDLFEIFTKKIEQALTLAKIQRNDLNAIELIGGASRIPKINTIVKNYFSEVEVGAHINGDESMAFGSALRAANLSLTFKVKQLYFYDRMNLETRVVISNQEKGVLSEQSLFTVADHHGVRKSISLAENSDDVRITVYSGEQIVKEFVSKGLGDWKSKYQDKNLTNSPNTVIEFMMSSVHIAQIKQFYINITLNVTEIKEKVEYVDEEVEIEQNEEKKEEEKKEQDKKEEGEGEKKEESAEQKTQDQVEPAGQNEQKTDEAEKEKKKKTKTVTKTIKNKVQEYKIEKKRQIVSFQDVFAKYPRISRQQIDEKKKIIQDYESIEKQQREISKLRNDFQTSLYNLKDDFDKQYLKTFGKEDEVESLKKTVLSELEWMDQNAWTASKSQIQAHYITLTKSYDPIYNRTVEYQRREKAYNQTLQYFGAVYKKTSELITTHPWIQQQIKEHQKKLNQTVKSINDKINEQFKRPLNENPLIYNHEMISKAESLRDEYYLLRLIPRPKKQTKTEQKKAQAAEQEVAAEDEPQEPENTGEQESAEGTSGEENSEETKEDL